MIRVSKRLIASAWGTSYGSYAAVESVPFKWSAIGTQNEQRGYSTEEGKVEKEIGNEKVRKLADEVLQMTLLEASWLTEILRKKLNMERQPMGMMPMMPMGIPGAVPGAGAAAAAPIEAAAPEPPKEEKAAFNVKLESFSAEGKIKVIKEVRALTSLGLKEAKDLVESAPVVIKELVPKADAENMKKTIEAAGGKVSLE